MSLITKLMNTNITMERYKNHKKEHSKSVMKIIKRLADIDHTSTLQICLSITGN